MFVKDDIQIVNVRRGLDDGHDEQWEGRVLASYTTKICFLGLYMPHDAAARKLLMDQVRAFMQRCNHMWRNAGFLVDQDLLQDHFFFVNRGRICSTGASINLTTKINDRERE